MRRRRDRVRARGSLLWWPLLVLAGLVVVAGGANRFYDLHRQGVTTYGVVVVGLALIGLYTYSRIRRWWR